MKPFSDICQHTFLLLSSSSEIICSSEQRRGYKALLQEEKNCIHPCKAKVSVCSDQKHLMITMSTVTKRNLATVQVLCRAAHWRTGRALAASTLQNPATTAAPWEEREATRRCGCKTWGWQHVPTAHLKKSLIGCVFKLEAPRAFPANTWEPNYSEKQFFLLNHWGKNVTHLVSYLDLPAATQTILPVFWLPATTHWDQLKSQIPGGTCWIIWRWSMKAAGKNVKRLQCEPPVLQGQHRTQHYNKNEPEPQAHFSPFDTVNSSRIKTHHSSETEVGREKKNKTLKNAKIQSATWRCSTNLKTALCNTAPEA